MSTTIKYSLITNQAGIDAAPSNKRLDFHKLYAYVGLSGIDYNGQSADCRRVFLPKLPNIMSKTSSHERTR